MPMKFQPFGSNVLVLPAKAETVSKGGIDLTASSKRKPAKGTIVAVGPGIVTPRAAEMPRALRAAVPGVGDDVAFAEGVGVEIVLEDEAGEPVKHLLMTAEDLHGRYVEVAAQPPLEPYPTRPVRDGVPDDGTCFPQCPGTWLVKANRWCDHTSVTAEAPLS